MQIQDSSTKVGQVTPESTQFSSNGQNKKCLTETQRNDLEELLKCLEKDHHQSESYRQIKKKAFEPRLQRSASNGQNIFLNQQGCQGNSQDGPSDDESNQQIPNSKKEQSTQKPKQQQQQTIKPKPKISGISDQIYNQHIKEEEDEFIMLYLNEFISDSIQFEALYYKLATLYFIRAPITSNPSIIIYYVFGLLTCYKNSNFEKITQQLIFEQEINTMFSRIEDGPFKKILEFLLFSRQKYDLNNLNHLFQEYLKSMICDLNQSDKFNFEIAIDDFEKYRNIYQANQTEIDNHQKEEVFKKFNLCIAYIRFIFGCPDDLSTFDIRIPVGEFQDKQLITLFDILQLINDNTKDRSFLEESWYKDNLGFHSERVLLVWIIQNQQYLADQIYKQIFARNYSQKNLKLLKVYLEITSEIKVCNTCITMFKRFLTHYVSDDIIAILQKMFKNIILTVNDQFKLIVVTQFLYESLAKINQQENIEEENNRQNKVDISFQDSRKVIYIDTKYVGLLTHKYLNLRYMSFIKNSEITQQIDKVRLLNSFFMSKEMDDDQEKSRKQLKDGKQSTNSSNRSIFQNAIIVLQEKMQILRNEANNPIKIEQIETQYIKEKNYLEQIRIQQCYSLILIMIQNMDELPTEANLFFLSRTMFYCLKLINEFPNIHYEFLFQKIKSLNQGNLDDFLDCVKNTILLKNILTLSNLNVKMLLRDYLFLIMNNLNNKNFNVMKNTWNQLKTNYKQQYSDNLGIIEAIFTVQQNNGEELRTNIKFESIYMKDIVNQQSGEVNKLQKLDFKIISIQYFICSLQQLSNQYKQHFQYQLLKQSNNFTMEFYYMFFKQLKPEQAIENNERQFIIYDAHQLKTRYHQENIHSQVSFSDMDGKTFNQRVSFPYDEHKDAKQMKQSSEQ